MTEAAETIRAALYACGIEDSEKVEVPGILTALQLAGFAVVSLPEPGPLSDHHDDDCKVWYFGQDGEVAVFDDDNVITDSEGFTFTAAVAREQAAALLAASLAVSGAEK